MKVWAIANQKGGVGKTTTTVALGGLLAAWGLRTLLVDVDPHGSLTTYFRYDPDAAEDSSWSLFDASVKRYPLDPRRLLHPTGTDGLDLIPSAMPLAALERQSGQRKGLGLVLKQAFGELRREYDYVLVDCPPVLGILLINALAACQHLIVPVQTEFLALKGLERMTRTLAMVDRARPRPLPYTVVPTFFDKRTNASRESLQVLRTTYPEVLWPGVIPMDTRAREAARAGRPPASYDPRSRGVVAYSELLDYLRTDAPASVAGV